MSSDERGGAEGEGNLLAGRYRLGERIGAGGMGAVHRATDTRLAREVAVKVLPAEALGDQAARQRLVREALACAALQHPGIVHVYDVGETDDGGAFLVMELVSGRSLRELIEDPSWTERGRILAIVEAARALAEANRAGVIHRDVKPDNLMMRDDGRIVLLDFGVAKPATESVANNLTGAGVVVGTPGYLSPEQARGRTLDARTDQFSLAVTAFELLTRSIPWDATSAIAVVAAIMNDPTPPLRLADAALAEAVRPVLERAMAKNAADRYPDADAFADALDGALGVSTAPTSAPASLKGPRSGVSSAFASTAIVDSTPAALAQTVAAPSAPQLPPSTKRPRRRVAAGAALLALAAVTTVGVWRSRKNPLDVASPVVACPMLEGTVDGQPAAWLGAAAASRLADDLAPLLGGFDEHVVYPAALLGLPGYAAGAKDLDPWTAPGLRERSVRAAASAGGAWLDGHVDARGAEIAIDVVVRTASGRELGRARATGSPLAEVALEVSRRLRAAGVLGAPHPLDPDFRAWRGVASADEQDATADLELQIRGHARDQLCKAGPPPALPPAWKSAVADGCAGRPLDATSPTPALAYAVAASPGSVTPEVRARLEREAATAPPGARKAIALGVTLQLEDASSSGAGGGILAVVAADPRAGWNGVREGMMTDSATFVSNALAWAPDNGDWWLTATRALGPTDRLGASEYLRREYVLDPSGAVSGMYADALLRAGDAADLDAVVAHLAGSEDAQDRDLGRLVSARAAVLDGAFARTLARWTDELSKAEALTGDTVDDNPRLSASRELAFAVGGERALGDAVARAVGSGNFGTRIAPHNVTIRANVAASCALADPTLALACVAALAPLDGAPALEQDDWRRVAEVVRRYVAGDFTKAADAARGLVGSPYYAYYSVRLGDFLADVFDRGGVPELAEALDRPRIDDRNLHGASLAALRAARRAWARGDRERARELAKRIVEAWRLVDMKVPAVAEMEAVLAHP